MKSTMNQTRPGQCWSPQQIYLCQNFQRRNQHLQTLLYWWNVYTDLKTPTFKSNEDALTRVVIYYWEALKLFQCWEDKVSMYARWLHPVGSCVVILLSGHQKVASYILYSVKVWWGKLWWMKPTWNFESSRPLTIDYMFHRRLWWITGYLSNFSKFSTVKLLHYAVNDELHAAHLATYLENEEPLVELRMFGGLAWMKILKLMKEFR